MDLLFYVCYGVEFYLGYIIINIVVVLISLDGLMGMDMYMFMMVIF